MKDTTPEMVENLELYITAWLEASIRELKQSALDKKMNVTQETIRSIMGAFQGLSPAAVGEVLISFKNSGRFLDFKKSPDWQKLPPVKELEEWVKKIGLNKFKYIPGYKNSGKRPTDDIAARRIAWGVAIHRYHMGAKRKKPWFAKLFYKKHIAQIIRILVEETGTASVRAITENFGDNNQ